MIYGSGALHSYMGDLGLGNGDVIERHIRNFKLLIPFESPLLFFSFRQNFYSIVRWFVFSYPQPTPFSHSGVLPQTLLLPLRQTLPNSTPNCRKPFENSPIGKDHPANTPKTGTIHGTLHPATFHQPAQQTFAVLAKHPLPAYILHNRSNCILPLPEYSKIKTRKSFS